MLADYSVWIQKFPTCSDFKNFQDVMRVFSDLSKQNPYSAAEWDKNKKRPMCDDPFFLFMLVGAKVHQFH